VKGHTDVARFLINTKANVGHVTPRGWGPLLYAAIGGHEEVTQLLVDAKADVRKVTEVPRASIPRTHIEYVTGLGMMILLSILLLRRRVGHRSLRL